MQNLNSCSSKQTPAYVNPKHTSLHHDVLHAQCKKKHVCLVQNTSASDKKHVLSPASINNALSGEKKTKPTRCCSVTLLYNMSCATHTSFVSKETEVIVTIPTQDNQPKRHHLCLSASMSTTLVQLSLSTWFWKPHTSGGSSPNILLYTSTSPCPCLSCLVCSLLPKTLGILFHVMTHDEGAGAGACAGASKS